MSQIRTLSGHNRVFHQHADVVGRLADACRLADTTMLRNVLDSTAFAVCDGVPGLQHGSEEVARLVTAVLCKRPAADLTVESVNGRPGLALRHAGRALAVVAIQVAGDRVAGLWIVVTPAKLQGWHHR